MTDESRDAWQRLYARHGLQYGGRGDIRVLEPFLAPGTLVLDAGCGDGKTTELLARKCEVVGCDFSREALAALKEQRSVADSLNLVECNLMSLPFESEKFVAISCIHALSHLVSRDRLAAAHELVRVLGPEGHLLVEVFGTRDIRYGEGEEIEHSTFLRGTGILTHYFGEREIPHLFPDLVVVIETSQIRRVTMGSVAGKRETIRILLRKPKQK